MVSAARPGLVVKEWKLKLAFETDPGDGVSLLHCNGQMSCGQDAGEFSKKLVELWPHSHRLVVDLSEIEIIDPAGLGELVIALMWTQAKGCELKLAAPSSTVHQLLELTSLLQVFETHATVEEAVLSFRRSPRKARAAACSAA